MEEHETTDMGSSRYQHGTKTLISLKRYHFTHGTAANAHMIRQSNRTQP